MKTITQIQDYKAAPNWEVMSAIIEGPQPSYAVLTDRTVLYFDRYNTPIKNFCNYGDEDTPIIINGQSVERSTIAEIYFCDGYRNDHFIGDFFLEDCSNLTTVDLSGLKELAWIGDFFLRGCENLTTLILGAAEPPRLGGDAFDECTNLSSIKLS